MEEKIGLALSGGGFRAAFFHVGVLARLAEMGILPKVEVISTVSGGSIVGAAYYLLLKRELEESPTGTLGADAYAKLVVELERRLRAAVQEEIRGRVLAKPGKNLRMAFSRRYSRSDRIGELYEHHLYRPVWSGADEERIEMRQLRIAPGGNADFKPVRDNPNRNDEKVPVLLINATSLNSGHNWRFEAIRMGEPLPGDRRRQEIVRETDANMRLEPHYFPRPDGLPPPTAPHVPDSQAGFPLAAAVAASACVPGLFHPLSISDMYRQGSQKVRVQLVDGGVQDNQGVQALLDRECSRLIVSDACGQLDDKRKPRTWFPLVAIRSAGIAGDRIRDEQLTYLPREGRKYALMHLRKGLGNSVVSSGDSPAGQGAGPGPEYDTDAFDVDASVQRALSEIRTDLDYFTDTEALSLELDGYLMSDHELKKRGFDIELGGGPGGRAEPGSWEFGAVAEKINNPGSDYLLHLRTGAKRFTRLLALRPSVARPLALLGLLALPALLLTAGWSIVSLELGLVASIAVAIGLLLLLTFLAPVAWGGLSLAARRLYPD